MSKFLPAFLRPFRPRAAARIGPALILRIENLAALTNRLGTAATIEMLGRIAGEISAGLRLRVPPQFSPTGDLCWYLPAMSDQDVLNCAVQLQALLYAAAGPHDSDAVPVLAAVVVQLDRGAAPHDQLFALGCEWMDGRRSVDKGRVVLLDASVIAPATAATAMRDDGAAFHPDQVEAVFEPQLSCDTGEVSGFRAQARLRNAAEKMLHPTEFVHDLDDAQTRALTHAMLRHALGALPAWDTAGYFVPRVSLAVTPADLACSDFADVVLWELDRLDLPAARLALEIEGSVAAHPVARQVLSRLTGCGCTLDLHDFGAGSASLDALRSLAPARVMIGPDFTTGCDSDVGAQQMILAVLSLAGHLNLPTLARAVATPREHGFLAQIGCDHVQGSAIAPAMTLADTLTYLCQQRSARAALPALARRA